MKSLKNRLLEDKDELGENQEVEEVEEVGYFTCPSIVDHRETEAEDTELTFSDKKYLKVVLGLGLSSLREILQDLDDLQAELLKLKLWTDEKCRERSMSRSRETSRDRIMDRSRERSMETSLERSWSSLETEADWDIVTEFIGLELAEFYRECEVRRVEHSHWSRSIEILCSDWLRS